MDSQENRDVLEIEGDEQVDLGALQSLKKRGASKTQSQNQNDQFKFSKPKVSKKIVGTANAVVKGQPKTSMQVASHKKSQSDLNALMNQSVQEKKSDVYHKALEEVRNPAREGDLTFQAPHKFREFIQEENEDDNSGTNRMRG
mmetsp:Transcript_23622/g.23315  ORF Transcript_23622/g.23315 Transcript_23622/m.23315 type:complete len:143 (-) Transcript_23622:187-615(-)